MTKLLRNFISFDFRCLRLWPSLSLPVTSNILLCAQQWTALSLTVLSIIFDFPQHCLSLFQTKSFIMPYTVLSKCFLCVLQYLSLSIKTAVLFTGAISNYFCFTAHSQTSCCTDQCFNHDLPSVSLRKTEQKRS